MRSADRRHSHARRLLAVTLALSAAFGTGLVRPEGTAAFTHGFYATPNFGIPDNGYNGQITSMVSDTMDASSIPLDHVVTDVSLGIWMSHSWVGDLTIKLRSPDGTVLTVLERPQGDGAANPAGDNGADSEETDNSNLVATQSVTFTDDAFEPAERIGLGRGAADVACGGTCEFRAAPDDAGGPRSFREAFGGQVARGPWTLLLADSSGGDTGTFESWSLGITHVRPVESCTSPPFADVPIDNPFCQEIQWMRDEQISEGFGDGTYRPSATVSRQAMSAFLARLGDADLTPCTEAPFTDVPISHPFCSEIAWMKASNISTGFGDGTYKPANVVTRLAMSAFLYRVVGGSRISCTAAPFTDVAPGQLFCGEIRWMRDNGISTGFADGSYRPGDPVTRQAMSAFMYRASFRM
jgi:subtilisin-like proprotein convertase family protein